MAGDVRLFVSDGSLRIIGDAAANDISIVQTAAGEFAIVGNAGESFTIDGTMATGPVAVTGITKTITMKLDRGNDAVSVAGLADVVTASRLFVFSGPGADRVSVSSASFAGRLSISTGNGDSSVDGVAARRAGVNMSVGDDTLSIAANTAVAFDTLLVSLGFGLDSLTIGAGTLSLSKGRSRFVGGPGNDSFAGEANLTQGSLERLAVDGFESVS